MIEGGRHSDVTLACDDEKQLQPLIHPDNIYTAGLRHIILGRHFLENKRERHNKESTHIHERYFVLECVKLLKCVGGYGINILSPLFCNVYGQKVLI